MQTRFWLSLGASALVLALGVSLDRDGDIVPVGSRTQPPQRCEAAAHPLKQSSHTAVTAARGAPTQPGGVDPVGFTKALHRFLAQC